jgi:hypothetical protein
MGHGWRRESSSNRTNQELGFLRFGYDAAMPGIPRASVALVFAILLTNVAFAQNSVIENALREDLRFWSPFQCLR